MRKIEFFIRLSWLVMSSVAQAQDLQKHCQEPQCFVACSSTEDKRGLESLLTIKAKLRYMSLYPAHVSGQESFVSVDELTQLEQTITRQRVGSTEGQVEIMPHTSEGFCIAFYPSR